jgi:hypothetical protein
MAAAGVLVVFDPRASSRRALERASALGAPLTVVALAPRDERGSRCMLDSPDLEIAVREAAARDLENARAQLGDGAPRASFVLLATSGPQEVARWAAAGGFTQAMIGARRAPLGIRVRDPLSRALRRAGIDVVLVEEDGRVSVEAREELLLAD